MKFNNIEDFKQICKEMTEIDEVIKDVFYSTIYKDLLLKQDEIYKILHNTCDNYKENIKYLVEFFINIVQYTLNNNTSIKCTLNYCKYFVKLLDYNGIDSGILFHSVGLLYDQLGYEKNAIKYFELALISDIRSMGKNAKNSNAFCVLSTTMLNAIEATNLFNFYIKLVDECISMSVFNIYNFREVLYNTLKYNKSCTELSDCTITKEDIKKLKICLDNENCSRHVRSKFKVSEKKEDEHSGISISLEAVVDNSEENKKFYKWTPSGEIKIHVVSIETANTFKVGKEYYVDFTECEDNL